jgi:hypothetical protein
MRLPWLNPGSAGPRKSLKRELIAALAIKLLALFVLWLVFFSRPAVPDMTVGMAPDRVAAAIVAPAHQPPHRQGTSQ